MNNHNHVPAARQAETAKTRAVFYAEARMLRSIAAACVVCIHCRTVTAVVG